MKTDIIENYILENIEKGIFQDKIDTEIHLSKIFKVSRITVRNAINNLVSQGVLRKVPGYGIYIAPNNESKICLNTNHMSSFREYAQSYGIPASTKVLNIKKIIPPLSIQHKMNLKENQEAFYYERINYLNSQAVEFETGYIRSDMFPEVTTKDLEISKFEFLKSYTQIKKVEHNLKPMLATQTIAKTLKLQGKPSLLAIEHAVSNDNNIVLECSISYYNPDKFYFQDTTLIG